MIFQLINEEKANWDEPLLIDAIENILKAFSERKHIVLASSNLFDKIKKNNKFSGKVRNAASVAKQYHRELTALIKHNYVNLYIQIDLAKKDSFEFDDKDEKSVFISGYSYFSDSLTTQNTSFIGEDLDDPDFYIYIGEFYIKTNAELSMCALSSCSAHGGGSQTYKKYKKLLKDKRLCYCIVDSDKKHPFSSFGNTCKALFKKANFKNVNFKQARKSEYSRFDQFGQVRILEVHEVECIIPIKILAKIVEEKKPEAQTNTIKRLEKMIEKGSDIRKYLDHKEGLTKQDAQDLDKDKQNYFIPELNKLMAKNNKCFLHENNEQIICDDNCFSLAGMGDKLLPKSLEILKNITLDKADIDKFTLPYWNFLGKEIFSWCCCTKISARSS